MNNIPKMRSIRETARLTGLSEFTIRRWVKQNRIVYVQADSKILVNVDRLLDFLNGEGADASESDGNAL